MTKYPLHHGIPLPERTRLGRPKNDNNDDELVAEGVLGIISKQYKSYSHAARVLAPCATQRVWEKKDKKYVFKFKSPATDPKNVVRRLAKKISEEHKRQLYKKPLQR